MIEVSIIIPFYNAEKTLSEAIKSAVEQDDACLEIIVVDDGSTDTSYTIAKEWSEKDQRIVVFRNDSNRGVSYSRNLALKKARGQYVRFLDADDTIPPDSTKEMLQVAYKYDSDLVIGIMQRSGSVTTYNFSATVKLAVKKVIDKHDLSLVHSFSNANKLFRMSIIREHGIQYKNYKLAEDGMFLYEFLYYAECINGCNSVVYFYYRPDFLEIETTTDRLTIEMLQDLQEIHDQISSIHKNASPEFHEELNKRFLKQSIIDQFYRKIWRLDEAASLYVKKQILRYKETVKEESWEEISKESEDLLLAKGVFSQGEISDNSILTIVINSDLQPEDAAGVVKSIYYQRTPFFNLILDERFRPAIPEQFRKMPNIKFVQGESVSFESIVQNTKTNYIAFISDPIRFMPNTINRALMGLKENVDYVSGICFRVQNGRKTTPILYRYLFNQKYNEDQTNNAMLDQLDYLVSNKIFKTNALKSAIKNSEITSEKGLLSRDIPTMLSHKRIKNIRYVLNYSNEYYCKTITDVYGINKILSGLKYSGSISNGKETTKKQQFLFVFDNEKMKRNFKKLYDSFPANKESFEIQNCNDINERMQLYNKYHTIIFETFDREILPSQLQEGVECYPLMNSFADSSDAIKQIHTYFIKKPNKMSLGRMWRKVRKSIKN